MNRPAVYRYFDAKGALLYCGCTGNPFARLSVHLCQTEWIGDISRVEIEWHPTRDCAEAAEAEAIRAEHPRHNIVAAPGGRLKGKKIGPRQKPDTPLANWLRASGTTAKSLAERMGVSHNTVCRWAKGHRFPTVLTAIEIERITSGAVPASSWVAAA